jgi:hypothetical protein
MKYQHHFPVHWLKYFPPLENTAAMVCPQFGSVGRTPVHDIKFDGPALSFSVSLEGCKSKHETGIVLIYGVLLHSCYNVCIFHLSMYLHGGINLKNAV